MHSSVRDNIHSAQCFVAKECGLQCLRHMYKIHVQRFDWLMHRLLEGRGGGGGEGEGEGVGEGEVNVGKVSRYKYKVSKKWLEKLYIYMSLIKTNLKIIKIYK